MGLTYGPLGTALAELFPTAVRYTGASLAFNLAGILGGSLAPYIATWLARDYGIACVGYYLSAAGAVTLVALLLIGAQPAGRVVADGALAALQRHFSCGRSINASTMTLDRRVRQANGRAQ